MPFAAPVTEAPLDDEFCEAALERMLAKIRATEVPIFEQNRWVKVVVIDGVVRFVTIPDEEVYR